jgi:hypothetical protein
LKDDEPLFEGGLAMLDAIIPDQKVIEAPQIAAVNCSNCGTRLAPDAVICVSCGHNLQSGKSLKTSKLKFRSTRSDSDLPVGLILTGAVTGGMCLMWLLFYFAAQNSEAAMVAYMSLVSLTSVALAVWAVFVARHDGIGTQLMILFVPFYLLYYVLAKHQGRALKAALLQQIFGNIFNVLLIVNAAQTRIDQITQSLNNAASHRTGR